ncbi:MAG TPA: hypothetical protein VLG92_03565 [Candidatus Saccharimonadia bacterium]|nr:hypothetical protein [Candidatus Saccharimonadia bacterium]
MKKRHIVFINLIFLSLTLFSAGMVYQFMTGSKPLNILHSLGPQKPVHVTTTACSTQKPLNLGDTSNPQLKKLAVYQRACHSFTTSTIMIFVGMPLSDQDAQTEAKQTAGTLKTFAKYHVRPLVMAEPTDYTTNDNVDMGKFAQGAYTGYLDTMLSLIHDQGITDSQMGIWNPFPEANLPYWNNNLPQYFAPDVNIYVSTLKKYFPAAQTSVMLNAATYEPTDFNWQNGNYTSLLPYVKGITPHSINYAGLEGFPWVPPQGGSGPILNAAEFLDPSIISEVADYLGTKDIWFNTGTFSEKYVLDPAKIAYVSAEQRQAVLTTINQQALTLQKQGYTVSINMFAQDKSKASEETNWSYWSNNSPFNSLNTPVLTSFIAELNQQHVAFWLFDQ